MPLADRDVAADDPVPAVEAVLLVEHVHRAAEPARATRCPCRRARPSRRGRSCHERARSRGRDTSSSTLIASARSRPPYPDRDRLLADVEVEEPTDLALHVSAGRLLFDSPDQPHPSGRAASSSSRSVVMACLPIRASQSGPRAYHVKRPNAVTRRAVLMGSGSVGPRSVAPHREHLSKQRPPRCRAIARRGSLRGVSPLRKLEPARDAERCAGPR